ncbi:heat shock factor protein 1 isoform X3 [Nasonia vitripennis]|uniref:HSF-type DNA-binding domain-containing protein n=1 Tax=Nasonia vitripennis TaxID=7425 RepID=A0A7M7QH60_NASVI|nr:heat shock factor protein 1 isoform X3 [Nasonia vitripennis]
MHTITEMGTSVPAFLGKLWRLVEDPETDDLICWAPSGRSFFIRNQAQFARELLPHYYKHNNMASFVRQLNMYGFHKKVSVELGGLKCDRDEMEFAHQYFCKDHPYLLEHIKRKIASNKTQDPSQAPIKPELMNRMLTEVRSMRGRQEHFDSRLGAMKRENEALWRELALLRQKHHKQQQIVNKLIHFLVSLVQPNRNSGLSMKRRYPLMIDDPSRIQERLKQRKMSKVQRSPTGPAIHELDSSDADLESDYIVAEMLDNDQAPMIESPEHQSVAEENMSEYYIDEPVQLPQDIEVCQNSHSSKKRFKGKKKGRKSKVPIKIFIPSSENGQETREETLMLEVPALDKVMPSPSSATQVENSRPTSSKPVPLATVRSSKLAAMAANMKKNQEVELDLDLDKYQATTETEPKDDSIIKLENILIVPDIMNGEYNQEPDESNGNTLPSSASSLSGNSTGSPIEVLQQNSPDAADVNNGSFGNLDFMTTGTAGNQTTTSVVNQDKKSLLSTQHQQQAQQQQDKNMSLSCVNSSDANFREEVDTHLDTMQSELENLRDILRGEGYSIDANTLLGVSNFERNLFGAEDPMSFGIPVNPDLDPHSNQEKDNDDDNHLNAAEQSDPNRKGELMTYSATPSLLDFDDDIFLGTSSSSPAPTVTDVANTGLSNDPLELSDNKGNIFDSLIAANTSNSPQS